MCRRLTGYEAVVEDLIRSGAHVNYRGSDEEGPLYMACLDGHSAVVKLLLENGAVPGEMEMEVAHHNGHHEILELFSRGSQIRKEAEDAMRKDTMNYQYESLSTETQSNIRLLKLYPGSGYEMIRLDMYKVNLGEHPDYETLSYEWGEKFGTIPVECEGRYLRITPNLKVALKAIRFTDQPRTLWIDALCIDQSNISERNQQVEQMTDIYRNAAATLVWLGPEKKKTEGAFEAVWKLAVLHDTMPSLPEWDPSTERLVGDPTDETRDIILGAWTDVLSDENVDGNLEYLLSRTYFERAWVLQEIIRVKQSNGTCWITTDPVGPHKEGNLDVPVMLCTNPPRNARNTSRDPRYGHDNTHLRARLCQVAASERDDTHPESSFQQFVLTNLVSTRDDAPTQSNRPTRQSLCCARSFIPRRCPSTRSRLQPERPRGLHQRRPPHHQRNRRPHFLGQMAPTIPSPNSQHSILGPRLDRPARSHVRIHVRHPVRQPDPQPSSR